MNKIDKATFCSMPLHHRPAQPQIRVNYQPSTYYTQCALNLHTRRGRRRRCIDMIHLAISYNSALCYCASCTNNRSTFHISSLGPPLPLSPMASAFALIGNGPTNTTTGDEMRLDWIVAGRARCKQTLLLLMIHWSDFYLQLESTLRSSLLSQWQRGVALQ